MLPGKNRMAQYTTIGKLLALVILAASLGALFILHARVAITTTSIYRFLSLRQDQTEKRDLKHPDRVISLFTTLRDVSVRETLHKHTLMNWASLAPSVLPVLFLMPNDTKFWTPRARELGSMVENVTRTREGVPVIKDMFNITATKYPSRFIGFANADNLFGKSLVDTLAGLSLNHLDLVHSRISLIVGRRRGIRDTAIQETTGEYVDSIAYRYSLFQTFAQDYFIFGNGGKFHWDRVPDFIVGRVGNDNWFVVMAQRWNVTLIDGTKTITNLHQEAADGVKSGWVLHDGRSKYYNYLAAGRTFNYSGGLTDCSFWRSTSCSPLAGNEHGNSSVCLEKNRNRWGGKWGGCRLPDF